MNNHSRHLSIDHAPPVTPPPEVCRPCADQRQTSSLGPRPHPLEVWCWSAHGLHTSGGGISGGWGSGSGNETTKLQMQTYGASNIGADGR